jgi:uncharacterized protein YjbI with pentapeptide repeats
VDRFRQQGQDDGVDAELSGSDLGDANLLQAILFAAGLQNAQLDLVNLRGGWFRFAVS